jgi:putative hydrolase of the HAD superfamily
LEYVYYPFSAPVLGSFMLRLVLLPWGMIQAILFDLDNTLYSSRYGLERNMGRRNLDFVAQYLGLSLAEAAIERRDAAARYGTTLGWLMAEKGFTAVDDYYAAVHPPGEEADLPPDPALRPFLKSLQTPYGILTNSPREHADRILAKLGVADLFSHIFDMRWNNMIGKPRPEAFRRALAVMGTSPGTTLFIDDYPSYVEGYLALGGRGILLDENNEQREFPGQRIRCLEEVKGFLD